MNKRFIKATAVALVAALLFSLLSVVAYAAPETQTKSVPTGDTSFNIDLIVNGGNETYAGIEFGLTISDESALRFVSFDLSDSITGATKSPFVTKDGVHYFGFLADNNAFSGRYTVGKLNFEGYTGSGTVTLTLSYMNVVRLSDDKTPYGQENSEAVLVITVNRASSGSNPNKDNIVVNVPDPEIPTTGRENEHYIDVVDPDLWYYDAVYYATDAGLMNGTGGNKFSPDIPVTRAMFVTILGRLAEHQGEETTGFSHPFHDVPADQWYTPFVNWAADKGIVLGHSATRFAPNDPVTREQMAALMIRFCDYMNVKLGDDIKISFSDAGGISDWAKDAVERAAAAGLMQGSNGSFRAKATATRAEVAQLFMNFMESYME